MAREPFAGEAAGEPRETASAAGSWPRETERPVPPATIRRTRVVLHFRFAMQWLLGGRNCSQRVIAFRRWKIAQHPIAGVLLYSTSAVALKTNSSGPGTAADGQSAVGEKVHRGVVSGRSANVSEAELEKFRHLEKEWWNPESRRGAGPLHSMNVTRVQYIVRQAGSILPEALPNQGSATPLAGLRALDVGCGGGLLSESLSRLGAEVVGIDPSPENVEVASAHAQGDPMTRTIQYEAVTAEELEARGERFDLVASLEVIEHVEDPPGFVSSLAGLTRPGGMLAMSTINRTPKSFALAIVGAEYLAGIVPVGTHDWRKFVPPEDLVAMLSKHGFRQEDMDTCGLIYNPVSGRWKENPGDLDVNYIVTALRSRS